MRRTMVLVVAVLLAAAALGFGAGQKDATPAAAGTSGAAVTAGKEAPMLAKLVGEGKLPPVAQRLPAEPLVVQPVEKIGKYGGTIRKLQTSEMWWMSVENLVKIFPETMKPVPNLATKWEVSTDYTTYTFHLRKGVKWSDGVPYTSADIMFWYEDLLSNKEFTPALPDNLSFEGKLVTVTAPDDYTVVFKFAGPKPTFMVAAAEYSTGHAITRNPKHYLKDFHPRYVSKEELDKKVKAAGMEKWTQLMERLVDETVNPDKPVISAWKLTTDPKATVQEATRNPYYWKVDPAGNQLPYIDSLKWQETTDDDVKVLKAMSGEVDLNIVTNRTSDIPVLKNNEAKGNYVTILHSMSGLNGAGIDLYVDQNYVDDADMAQLLRNVTFRRAVSVAINRKEINEFTALGFADERQAILTATHPASSQAMEKQYVEYDPTKANQWLDEAGLAKRDKDGYRLLANGKPLTLILSPYGTSGWRVDSAELIKTSLEKVGIRTVVKPEDGSLWVERAIAGHHQISVYGNSNGMEPLNRPSYYFPVSNASYWAPLYGQWYATGGKEGVMPDADHQKLIQIYEAAAKESDVDKQNALIRQAMQMHADNLWQIGIVGYAPWPLVKNVKLRNFEKNPGSYGWNSPYMLPEQYYYED